MIRCAMYGLVLPRLAIGVTATTALSSQSVMTLARTGPGLATARDATINAAEIERQNDARMVSSVASESVCACNITQAKRQAGRLARAGLPGSWSGLWPLPTGDN